MSTLTPVAKVFAQVHSPGLPFPKTVAALLALSVTRYHVDYASALVTTYSSTTPSKTITTEQVHSPSPKVKSGTPWSQDGIVNAIKRVQSGQTATYEEFSGEIIDAGGAGYIAFLTGQCVLYYGHEGDMHVEWFPGAGPKQSENH